LQKTRGKAFNFEGLKKQIVEYLKQNEEKTFDIIVVKDALTTDFKKAMTKFLSDYGLDENCLNIIELAK